VVLTLKQKIWTHRMQILNDCLGYLVGLVGWLAVWLVYSCCSQFEHRTSVKRFVSPQFLNPRHSVGLRRVIISSQGRYLTHTQTSMPQVGFQPTIPAFERAKTVHALDRATTVTSELLGNGIIFSYENWCLHNLVNM
jgi:hypothetical protein